jgi:eukaryotic-like serine/threonine-protein kinase
MTTYPTRLSPGQILGDRFQVASLVGSGDLGEVYDVREVGTGYAYALKTLPGSLLQTQALTSFQQEAQRITGLGNEAILGVYAFDVDAANQQPYILRELVATPSLAQQVESTGPLRAAELAPVLSAVATALDSLHQAGIIHGNLKPGNVFPAPSATAGAVSVRLADGAQSLLRGPLSANGLGFWGTPGFLPYEQTTQPPSHPSADLFALGVLVFFALTGRLPFRAAQGTPNGAALTVELQAALPPASHRARELGAALGEEFDGWFSRALAVAPASRFPSASAMAESFRAVAAASPGAVAEAAPAPAGPETSTSYTRKGTLMLGQLTPEMAAMLHANQTPPPAAPGGGDRPFNGNGTALLGQSPLAGAGAGALGRPGEVAISNKLMASTELATVPPGRLPAPPSLAGASMDPGGFGTSGGQAPPQPLGQAGGAGFVSPGPGTPVPATPMVSTDAGGPVSLSGTGIPKKSKAPLMIAVLVGLLALVGVIGAAVYVLVIRPNAESEGEGDQAAAAASASGAAATVAPSAATAPVAPTESAAPPASAAPEPPPPATDSLVSLVCDPTCDAVVCDKVAVKDFAAGVRLKPGKHVCTARKAGYTIAPLSFTTEAGADVTQTFALTKVETAPPKGTPKKGPCGTFVNPCK